MTVDANKDEAERCVELAESAFNQGNIAKAEKLAWKAERLYPTVRAKNLLERIKLTARPNSTPDDELRRRKPSPQRVQKEFTPEQVEAVKRIVKCKDYYEVLSVTKESTDSEIKKSYKKLALQLHPDKNHAPGAAEAFKTIGNAAAVLTDPEKRKQYDLRGEEPTPNINRQYHYRTRGFESDLTAEELFNMFFGASQQHMYTRRRYQQREPEQRDPNNSFIQLIPILVLIFLSLMSGYFVNEPVYSLTPGTRYPVPRETINLKIPYYVKDNFHTDYQGSLRRLEMSIEEEYLLNLRHMCQRERNLKETLAWKARNFGDAKQLHEAQSMQLPSCQKLQSFNRFVG